MAEEPRLRGAAYAEPVEGQCLRGSVLYLGPDGSLQPGSGFTGAEQRRLLQQLVSQKLVEVTEEEAARILGGGAGALQEAEWRIGTQAIPPVNALDVGALAQPLEGDTGRAVAPALGPEEDAGGAVLQALEEGAGGAVLQALEEGAGGAVLQALEEGAGGAVLQALEEGDVQAVPPQDTKLSAAPDPRLAAMTFMQNAAQQLQSVAQHVALQNNMNAVTRLIQHKQLESIQIKVQPVQMKENHNKLMSPLAAIHLPPAKLNQPSSKTLNTSGLSLGSQIIRMQPVTNRGEQQFILQNSTSDPPIHLLVPRPTTPLARVSFTKVQKNTCAIPTLVSAVVASVTENHPVCSLEKKQKQKLQRSLKVKTRSGRISRPPKHKAKDYKFIKTEDLADGRVSDSDDYSELSLEEEEDDVVEKDALLSPSNYNWKPKMFKCETCEKSYIGKGGLARHYKLNPEHGNIDYFQQKIHVTDANSDVFLVDSLWKNGKTDKAVLPERLSMAGLNDESLPPPHVEEIEIDSLSDQQSGQSVEAERLSDPLEQDEIKILWSPVMRKGPGRPKGCRRSNQPRMVGRPRCSRRCGGPATSVSSVTAEKHILRRKARLKELLQQCENEDLMELALPRLTELITVYEFLLMKVERGHPAKPFFPDVYTEFESLHRMVQNMAQDYFSNASFLTIQQTLEIKNPKVADSLGITEKLCGKQNHILNTPQDVLLNGVDKQLIMERTQQNHSNECTGQEWFPPIKKMRTENVSANKSSTCAKQNGIKQNTVNWCVPSTEEGGIWQRSGSEALPYEKGCIIGDSTDVIMECASVTESHRQQYKELVSLETRTNSSNSDLLFYPSSEEVLDCSQSTSVSVESDNIGNMYEHSLATESLTAEPNCESKESVSSHFTNQNSQCRMLHSESSNSLPPVDGTINQRTHLSNGEQSQHIERCIQELQHHSVYQDTHSMRERSEQLTDIADQMQQLENTFSVSVPTDHFLLHKTQSESLHSIQETSSTQLNNLGELPCSIEEPSHGHCELENAITVDGTVSFDVANESHELLTHGHQQIFIQTSDGLILSHPGGAVLPNTGLFIVTNADGTTMHIRTPHGVPLETVEALLAMEAEGQSEGVLISQSEIEQEM